MPTLTHQVRLPHTAGKIVEDYLKVLSPNVPYPAWTITNGLGIQACEGVIQSNESWNYHNNYDDSENELYVVVSTNPEGRVMGAERRWFTLNKEEAIKIQQENIASWKAKLEAELQRLAEMTNT